VLGIESPERKVGINVDINPRTDIDFHFYASEHHIDYSTRAFDDIGFYRQRRGDHQGQR
jgi:hypothetical protein